MVLLTARTGQMVIDRSFGWLSRKMCSIPIYPCFPLYKPPSPAHPSWAMASLVPDSFAAVVVFALESHDVSAVPNFELHNAAFRRTSILSSQVIR